LIASANGKLYKFRVSDGQLQAEYDIEPKPARDLEIDSQGRLWYGTQDGIWVYGIFENDQIVELAKRSGIPCGRIALREELPTIHAYCVDYRGAAVIHRVPIDF
jgi:ligand-binding sensor domain-containing protein